jgi:sugar-specific transcriptional regulator TrmB
MKNIISKEDYNTLMQKLGVSETEAKIYRALLERRELSALEIHELTKVPRTKVYEVTQKMMLRGMCMEKQMGRKKKYQAIEPQRALSNLVKPLEDQLNEQKNIATDLIKMVDPIYDRGMKKVHNLEYIEIIHDRPSIHERYVSLVKNTKKELLGFVKPPFAHKPAKSKLIEQESAEYGILKKGVIIRVLYEFPDQAEFNERLQHIRSVAKRGERSRVIEHLPIKMYIFDKRYVLMALANAENAASLLTMVVIEHPGLAEAGALLFHYLWDQAHDWQYLESKLKGKAKRKD